LNHTKDCDLLALSAHSKVFKAKTIKDEENFILKQKDT